jgi:hypothetical protein
MDFGTSAGSVGAWPDESSARRGSVRKGAVATHVTRAAIADGVRRPINWSWEGRSGARGIFSFVFLTVSASAKIFFTPDLCDPITGITMHDKKYVIDDFGRKLNAQVLMNTMGESFRLRFLPIPGVSTTAEFSEALEVSLGRLAQEKLLITDALVMNPPNRRFPPAQRRLMVSGETYPIFAQTGEATSEIAFWFTYRAREIARERFLSGSDIPNVAIDIRFRLPLYELNTLTFLHQELKRMKAELDETRPSAEPLLASEPPPVRSGLGKHGQGRLQDAVLRSLIDAYAMQLAVAHFKERGWQVTDVSAFEPFDLRCTQDSRELHVEVKGSTTAARSVMLTRNEVQHARDYPDTALFVASTIEIVDVEGTRTASGGNIRVYQPWKINADDLEAQTYCLTLREK